MTIMFCDFHYHSVVDRLDITDFLKLIMGFRRTSVCYTEYKDEAYKLHIIASTVGR